MSRILIGTLMLSCMGVILAGCGGSPGTAENVLNVGNRSEVQDLDPHIVTGIAEFRALGALFEGLTGLNPESMAPVPATAESWSLSEDGKVYTFKIRETAKWSNGDPVTAHDFAYAWKRMLTPGLASEYSYMLHCMKNAKAYNDGTMSDFNEVGAKVIDDYTLEVTLENPTPYFLGMQIHYSWFPVHQATIENFGRMEDRGSAWTRAGNHVGNGPFRLLEWNPDAELRVVRSETYWDARNVKLDGVTFFPISDEMTEERSFRSGALDLTYTVPMHKVEEYQRESPALLQIFPYVQTYFYRFNTTRPPFDDRRVRQAFGLAIDRAELAKNVLKSGEAPAYFLTPPNTAGYTCTYKVADDVEKARALLAEAGYPDGQGLPPMDLLYNTSQADKVIAEAVQQMWKKGLNAQVEMRNQDYKVYLSSMTNLDYGICRSTWLADVLDPINFLECFLAGEGNNRTGFASEEYDGLIRAAYAEADTEVRFALLQKAEALLLEEAPISPVCFMTQKYLKKPEVKGLIPNSLGYIRWQDLYLEP